MQFSCWYVLTLKISIIIIIASYNWFLLYTLRTFVRVHTQEHERQKQKRNETQTSINRNQVKVKQIWYIISTWHKSKIHCICIEKNCSRHPAGELSKSNGSSSSSWEKKMYRRKNLISCIAIWWWMIRWK